MAGGPNITFFTFSGLTLPEDSLKFLDNEILFLLPRFSGLNNLSNPNLLRLDMLHNLPLSLGYSIFPLIFFRIEPMYRVFELLCFGAESNHVTIQPCGLLFRF